MDSFSVTGARMIGPFATCSKMDLVQDYPSVVGNSKLYECMCIRVSVTLSFLHVDIRHGVIDREIAER